MEKKGLTGKEREGEVNSTGISEFEFTYIFVGLFFKLKNIVVIYFIRPKSGTNVTMVNTMK